MRYGTHGTAFDLSDVRAQADRDARMDRCFAACMSLRRRAWRQGYRAALETVDVTITDGVPVEVDG